MQTTEHAPQTADLFIAEGRRVRDFLNLFPQGVRRLLVVLDPADPAGPILDMVLCLAEQWHPHITLSHGGRLREAALKTDKADRDDLVDLLCLGWELKNRYSDVSTSRTIVVSPRHVLAEAGERRADVILVPEALSAGFRSSMPTESEGGSFLPCPIVIVMEAETDRSSDTNLKSFR